MKTTLSILAVSIALISCNNSKQEAELDKQHFMDSINSANAVARAVDSVNKLTNSTAAGLETNTMTVMTVQESAAPVAPIKHGHAANTPQAPETTKPVAEPSTPKPNAPATNSSVTTETTTTSTSTVTEKKTMSNKTKGAVIGGVTGAAAGAAAGAILDKNNRGAGAVLGGIIGGAVGSGVGYGVGNKKDKKDTTKKTTTKP